MNRERKSDLLALRIEPSKLTILKEIARTQAAKNNTEISYRSLVRQAIDNIIQLNLKHN